MRFGKTLSERITEEWRIYAVDYKGMKKTLPKDLLDVDEVCVDGLVDPDSHSDFWSIYDESKSSLDKFYTEKVLWAKEQLRLLTSSVEKKRLSLLPGATFSSVQSIDLVRTSLSTFERELDLFVEFLELNRTGFSKILKKYDKRTVSYVREEKLAELRQNHAFFNGNELLKLKVRLKVLMSQAEKFYLNGIDGDNVQQSLSKNVKLTSSLEKAQRYLRQIEEDSSFFSKNEARPLPSFTLEEIRTGPILGEGEFGTVREIREFRVNESCHICFLHRGFNKGVMSTNEAVTELAQPQKERSISSDSKNKDSGEDTNESVEIDLTTLNNIDSTLKYIDFYPTNGSLCSDLDAEELESDHENVEVANRGFMKDHCLREGSARYAIKQLRTDLSSSNRMDGAIDISIEAKFLAVLEHPNIIKMRGTGGIPGHPKVFLVLDRLYDTLGTKCEKWKTEEKKYAGFLGLNKSKRKRQTLWNDRLVAAFDVARAMKYLHDHKIVYRDLKPENIGFDVRGDAKIFDFGLAKELQPKDHVGEDQYKASGMTGTRRYMAPEVALWKPYGLAVDVYSFAILLWEILSLKTPFEGYSCEKHARQVIRDHKRLHIPKSWPVMIKDLICESWMHDPAARPQFSRICGLLRGELVQLDYNDLSERSFRLMNRSISSKNG